MTSFHTSHSSSLISILILYPYVSVGVLSGLSPSDIPCVHGTCLGYLLFLDLITLLICGEELQIMKLLFIVFYPASRHFLLSFLLSFLF